MPSDGSSGGNSGGNSGGRGGLNQSDKIELGVGIGVGVPGGIAAIVGAIIAWCMCYKRPVRHRQDDTGVELGRLDVRARETHGQYRPLQ
jgi:uncharacterized oligopeptide transporter (OPT) family protein